MQSKEEEKKSRDFNLTNERTACINCITIDGTVTHFIMNFDTNSIQYWIVEWFELPNFYLLFLFTTFEIWNLYSLTEQNCLAILVVWLKSKFFFLLSFLQKFDDVESLNLTWNFRKMTEFHRERASARFGALGISIRIQNRSLRNHIVLKDTHAHTRSPNKTIIGHGSYPDSIFQKMDFLSLLLFCCCCFFSGKFYGKNQSQMHWNWTSVS